jgi:hypothetical protein
VYAHAARTLSHGDLGGQACGQAEEAAESLGGRVQALVAGRGFTPERWEEVVPEQDYIEVCPAG